MTWFFWRTRRAVQSPCHTWLSTRWEALEDRTLLSSTASIVDRVVAVTSSRHRTTTPMIVQTLRHTSTRTGTRTSTRSGTSTRHRAGNKPTASNTAVATPLATLTLNPLDLNLLGLEVKTGTITITLSDQPGNGELLGNLLNTASTLVDLQQASTALNRVLSSTVDLLNSASLAVSGVGSGALTNARAVTATPVVQLAVAPVHFNLMGVEVDTSPIQLSITAHSGNGQVLGNVLTDLANLFNPPLPSTLDINTINAKLAQLLSTLQAQISGITPAQVPTVTATPGQVASLTVPALNLNLLGLGVQTSPITVNADAQTGNGLLLGNVLTTALNTLSATPQNLADLDNNLDGILAEVVGVLNASSLTLSSKAVGRLPAVIQQLLSPTLTSATPGSTTQVLNLVVNSTDGTSPPVNVNLLGLDVTTSDVKAVLTATTGDGQVLGNLLFNLANLDNPDGAGALLNLFDQLASGANKAIGSLAGATDATTAPQPAEQLLQVNLKPLDINLLGLEVKTDPITVTISSQQGDGELLGNVLTSLTTLLNLPAVNTALNNVLATTVNLVNSATLAVNGVAGGSFTDASPSDTPVLDLTVAPVHLNLLGLLVDTQPIHATIIAHAGSGQILGNVVTDLANLFNPPLPSTLDIDTINAKLAQLLTELNQQIPGIAAAPVQPVTLSAGQALSLTVPPINLNLLGLLLNTSAITVNATDQTGNGLLLGNVLKTVLNTLGATPANLTTLSNDLNGVLAKVVGVLNASSLTLPAAALALLPTPLQTLASSTLLTSKVTATAPILDLTIASPAKSKAPPVDVNLLGLDVTTSNITAHLSAQTGDGEVLGNLLYNVANLLNPGESLTLLSLLTELSQLTVA